MSSRQPEHKNFDASDLPLEFHSRFCCQIRVKFNWRRLFVEDWPIALTQLQKSAEFSTLRLPWYWGGSGFVRFDADDASPVRLVNIEEWYRFLPEKQRNYIDELKSESLRSGTRPIQFEFPVYAIPGDEHLVLDGNHRLSALALAQIPFKVDMWVIQGPIEPTALADLTHIARWGRV